MATPSTFGIPITQYDPSYRGAGAKMRATDVTDRYQAVTANTTLVANTIGNEAGVYSLTEVISGSPTITLPTAVGIVGYTFKIKNTGSGTAVLAAAAGQTIDGAITKNLTQYQSLEVTSNNAGWLII